jgi:hypothetical protein
VSPEDLRAEAVWLNELAGGECPWPIETVHDLREWAHNVATDTDRLTGAELRRVDDLIERLDPPEKRRLTELRRQEAKVKAEAWITWFLRRGKALSALGAAARKQKGEENRAAIIRTWKSLGSVPVRDRAKIITRRVPVSARHVRRVLRNEGLK